MLQHKKHKTVYVIGAGFSAGLGFPVTSDLLVRLWPRLDNKFKIRLKKVIQFHHPHFLPNRSTSFPNIEILLSQMIVNEELFDASRRYEGAFKKKELINIRERLLKELREWFHTLAKEATAIKPKWLEKLRDRITKENAVIISFNWDLVLDSLLFGKKLSRRSYGFGETGNSPILLKPHGSLNWFELSHAVHINRERRIRLFNRGDDEIYAFRRFRSPISKKGWQYIPLLIPPVHTKNFDRPFFQELWRKCTSCLSTAKKVIFIGYSMPISDRHVQFILRCGFHNQIEGQLRTKGRAKATGPARVLIINPDQSAAQRTEGIIGRSVQSTWISIPTAQWISGHP